MNSIYVSSDIKLRPHQTNIASFHAALRRPLKEDELYCL